MIVKEVPEADQAQSTLERQPSASRADTSCAGAGVRGRFQAVCVREQPCPDSAEHC